MTVSILHKILAAAGIAGFSVAAALPTAVQAQCAAVAAACNPCAAAARNPCAVAACNPCAATEGYNPCKTRWASP